MSKSTNDGVLVHPAQTGCPPWCTSDHEDGSRSHERLINTRAGVHVSIFQGAELPGPRVSLTDYRGADDLTAADAWAIAAYLTQASCALEEIERGESL